MKIIAILNQKGGTGKSTFAVNFALYLRTLGYSVLAIDSDAQGSLKKTWHTKSGGELFPVLTADTPTLHKDIKSIKEHDFVIIDGAGNVSAMTTSAARCANIILIPVDPGYEPLRSSEDTLEIINEVKALRDDEIKVAYILTRCREGTNSVKKTAQQIEEKGYHLLPTRLYLREAYGLWQEGLSILDVEPKGKAANEIKSITNDILEFING